MPPAAAQVCDVCVPSGNAASSLLADSLSPVEWAVFRHISGQYPYTLHGLCVPMSHMWCTIQSACHLWSGLSSSGQFQVSPDCVCARFVSVGQELETQSDFPALSGIFLDTSQVSPGRIHDLSASVSQMWFLIQSACLLLCGLCPDTWHVSADCMYAPSASISQVWMVIESDVCQALISCIGTAILRKPYAGTLKIIILAQFNMHVYHACHSHGFKP